MSVSWNVLALPLVEVVLMGALAGIVGALALVHRRIFFTESLTHSTFPGAVAGVVVAAALSRSLAGQRADYDLLTAALFVGAVLMCLPMIALMRWLSTIPGLTSQSAAGIVLTFGFALGYFLAKWFAPLPLKVDGFLTGSVLNIGTADVAVTAAVLVGALAVLAVAGRFLAFHGFDPVGYRAAGLRPGPVEAVLMILICLTIAALVPAVGTILPIALVAAPAAAIAPWCSSMRSLVVGSALLGAATGVAGMWLGVALGLLGAAAVLVWAVVFSPLLALRSGDVTVTGSDGTVQAADVQRIVAAHEGISLVRLDPAALGREVADSLVRVRAARVTRSWPHGVRVDLTMRRPIAVHEVEQGYEVLDSEAVVLETVPAPPSGLVTIAGQDGAEPDARAVTAVTGVVGSLDADTLARVAQGSAGATGQVTLVLSDGARVRWGDASESALKARVLKVLLSQRASVYDVSSPHAPTTS